MSGAGDSDRVEDLEVVRGFLWRHAKDLRTVVATAVGRKVALRRGSLSPGMDTVLDVVHDAMAALASGDRKWRQDWALTLDNMATMLYQIARSRISHDLEKEEEKRKILARSTASFPGGAHNDVDGPAAGVPDDQAALGPEDGYAPFRHAGFWAKVRDGLDEFEQRVLDLRLMGWERREIAELLQVETSKIDNATKRIIRKARRLEFD